MVIREKKHWLTKSFTKYSIFAMLLLTLLMGNTRVVSAESVVNAEEAVTVLHDYTAAYGWEPSKKKERVKIEGRRSRRSTNNMREVVYLAVFVTFPDVTSTLDKPEKVEAAELLLNTGGEVGNTGGNITVPSLKQSVEKVTYGKLTTTSHIFPRENAGSTKVVSFTAPNPRSYYIKRSGSNPNGYTPAQQRVREAELVTGAINAMKQQVTAAGITEAQLDSDSDGAVDAISFFVDGGLSGITWSDLLWPHKIDASAAPLKDDPRILGKRISAWNLITGNANVSGIGDVFSKNRPSYAVIFHEYLHTLGLPDLYRGNIVGDPVGTYDVMAQSTIGYPQGIMAVMAEDRRWHNPLPEVRASGSVTVSKPKYKDPNEKIAVKIRSPYSDKEYFVAEYYVRNPLEARLSDMGSSAYSDSDGLLISRVKTDEYNGNLGKGPGADMLYVFRPGEPSPSKGSGKANEATLNMGKKRTRLGKTTSGSGFDNETVFLSDGTNSGVVIEITSETADTITFDVTIPVIQGTGTQTDPYLLSKPSDFELVRNLPQKYFKITKDIDFAGVTGFEPIKRIGGGNPATNKPGVLDGNNKTIKNLTIANPAATVAGFFEDVDITGVVKDLTFENLNVTDRGVQVGGLAAAIGGTVDNVAIKSGSITNTAVESDFKWNTVVVGGIGGYLRDTGTIRNSYNSAAVTGNVYAGGLTGESQNGTLTDNYANGTIQAPKSGGIIGLFRAYSGSYKMIRKTYYDKKGTNTTKGINETDGTLTVPAVNGTTGVTAPNEIALDLNGVKEKDLVFTFDPTSGAVANPLEISVVSTAIAEVNSRNKIAGVSAGRTKATGKFPVGPHKMGLETEVVVTGAAAKPVPAAADFKTDLSSKTYNKRAQGVTVSAKDGVTGLGTITVKYKKGTAAATTAIPIQAGTYEVLVDAAEGTAYQAGRNILLGEYTITPIELSAVSVSIPDVLVSSPIRLTGQTLGVTGTNIVTGDTVNATNSTIQFPSTATAGSFRNATVTLGALNNENYRVSNTNLQNQAYRVINRTLTRIYVHTRPNKTVYVEGEIFDKRGMVVKAQWQGGVETDVTAQAAITPVGPLSVGTNKVTITYNGKTVEQSIQVRAKKVPAVADFKVDLSSKTYNKTAQGVSVSAKDNVTGLGNITVTYKKGTNSAAALIPVQAGTYEVLVDVGEGSHYQAASQISLGTYTIEPVRIANGSVSLAPIQKGAATQLTGQTLAVRGTNLVQGDTVNAGNCTITFPSTDAEGTFLDATVTIGVLDNTNYRIDNNRLENQSYRVMAATLNEIRITSAPDKTSYFEGESFDHTGMVVKGIWSDGTESDVSAQAVIMPSGPLGTGDIKVTITYGSQSVEQAITVKKVMPITLEITTPPTKVKYVEGEVFDPSDMELMLVYNNGSTEIIAKGYQVSGDPLVLGTTEVEIKYERDGQVFLVSQAITVSSKPGQPDQPQPPKPEEPKPEKPSVVYPDVKVNDWFYGPVNYVTSNGIMSGYSNGTFGASDLLGRGQFATTLYRMEDSPKVNYESLFSDVPSGQFYSTPVVWANKNKIITGYESGMFGATDTITREQLATIMYRYAKYKGIDVSVRADLNSFPDGGKVSSFAREAMSWVVGEGIISGTQGKLSPHDATSRAVAATILERFNSKK